MSKDGWQTLRNLLMGLLAGLGVLAGTALTYGAAWIGLNGGPTFGNTCKYPKLLSAKMRVKAGRDAAGQYILDAASCPHSIDELIATKYLDKAGSTDPWGSTLALRCPGVHDTDGADVSSAGQDGEWGTLDDIRSWDL